MDLSFWSYNIENVESFPEHIYDEKNTILANSVIASNYQLINKIKSHQNILEIGCGKYSWLKDNLKNEAMWKGIDINKSIKDNIATEFGSVHSMPYEDCFFDFIISNQSIEHWSEYGVSIEEGLSEIYRCLKENGEAYVNFPIFLHGHPDFVKGNIGKIRKNFERFFYIENFVAYNSIKTDNYLGWRRCGFPDWYIPKHGLTSFVVNAVLKKKTNIKISKKKKRNKFPERKSIILIHLRHGLIFFIWKIYNFLKKKISN